MQIDLQHLSIKFFRFFVSIGVLGIFCILVRSCTNKYFLFTATTFIVVNYLVTRKVHLKMVLVIYFLIMVLMMYIAIGLFFITFFVVSDFFINSCLDNVSDLYIFVIIALVITIYSKLSLGAAHYIYKIIKK